MKFYTTVVASTALVVLLPSVVQGCAFTAFSGYGCSGAAGKTEKFRGDKCIKVTGRKSYQIDGNCGGYVAHSYDAEGCGGGEYGQISPGGNSCNDITRNTGSILMTGRS